MEPTPRTVTAEDGTTLRLWSVVGDHVDGASGGGARATGDAGTEAVLFVHGATYPGRAVFAPEPAYSWLAATAESGRDAFALDVRGYGESDPPAGMETEPGEAEPPARADAAALDVRAALSSLEHDRVHLVGYSWGTVIAGTLLAATDAPAVASYTAFAPVFRLSAERVDEFDLGDPPRPARVVTRSEARERWESQFPEGTDPDEWRDAPAFRAFWDAVHDSNQGLFGTEDPAIRAPNGTLVDLRRTVDGAPYDPGAVDVPTLVVRGSNDPTATREDALALYDALEDARRYVELADGTHFMPLEHRRDELYATLNGFLDSVEPGDEGEDVRP
jgi:pimeloyl-ACP methyl ester carboxylesterase